MSEVAFVAVGDLMLNGEVSKAIEKKGLDFPFLNVISDLKKGDILIGNLETPLTRNREKVAWDYSKYAARRAIYLKGSLKGAAALRNAGFGVVSVANNHILDYGIEGATDTLTVLRKNGIRAVGFGLNSYRATTPVYMETKGVRFAFLACSFAYEATFFSAGGGPIGLYSMRKSLKKARETSNIVVVSLHIGIEFADSPSQSTIQLAHALIEKGADLVLCHHPHVLQKIERYKRGLIAYSLGNFVFDYDSFLKHHTEQEVQRARQSIILKCVFDKHGLTSFSFTPVLLNDDLQPTPIPETSELYKRIYARVNGCLRYERYLKATQSSSCKRLIEKQSLSARNEKTQVLSELVASLRRKDVKSIYILLRKTLERLYERTVVCRV